jgi:hypothetical protein
MSALARKIAPIGILMAAVCTAASAAMPAGTYRCQRLMAETLDGAGPDDFLPTVVGTITFTGKDVYKHAEGNGLVASDRNGVLHLASGGLQGTLGALRKDPKGREYFLIDKSITDPPGAAARKLDVVCYRN